MSDTLSHPVIDAIAPSANNRYSVAPLLTTGASGSLSHPVIDAIAPSANNRYSVAPLLTTEASGSERSGEIPQTESDYVHADFSTRPPLAGLVEMTIEKKTATVEMTIEKRRLQSK